MYCCIDFEFTCDGRYYEQSDEVIIYRGQSQTNKAEMISVGLVILDNNFNIIEEYYKTAKPVKWSVLTDYCKNLTGLTQEEINDSKPAAVVCKEVFEILKKYQIKQVFNYGTGDVPSLETTAFQTKKVGLQSQYINYVKNRLYDVSYDIMITLNRRKRFKLSDLYNAAYFDEMLNYHNALTDAKILAKVLAAVCDKDHEAYLRFTKKYLIRKKIGVDFDETNR